MTKRSSFFKTFQASVGHFIVIGEKRRMRSCQQLQEARQPPGLGKEEEEGLRVGFRADNPQRALKHRQSPPATPSLALQGQIWVWRWDCCNPKEVSREEELITGLL